MRIVCAWNQTVSWADKNRWDTLRARAFASFDQHLPGWQAVELPQQNNTAYHNLLADLWTVPEDLLIVEHDMVVHADVLPQFQACPNVWCGFEYLVDTWPIVALGCTRFRAELITEHPDLFTVTGEIDDDGLPLARDWRRADARLDAELRRRGYQACRHTPRVTHLHIY